MSSGGEGEEPGTRRDRHRQAAAQAAGAGVGTIMGGPVGAIVGAALGPLLVPFAQRVWAEVSGDGQRRGGEMLAAAQETIGGDPEELERLVLASDQSRLQAGIALSAATRTAWPPKVIALGRALAAGLVAADDARILTEPFIMAALADIEFPHASLLELLVRHWPLQTPQGLFVEPFGAAPGRPWGAGSRIWLAADIVAVRPALRPVLPSLLGTLQRHGLAAQPDDPGDPAMQPLWMREATKEQLAAGVVSPVVSAHGAQFKAPAGAWLPTELGEEVLDALLEAGAAFED